MTPPRLLDIALASEDAKPLPLNELRHWPKSSHVFDESSIWAINAALMSGRPLLLRGEPGSGKSQLARAAAQVLGWPFLSRVVNARFEPEDLLYRFDAVARLAQAQILPRTDTALLALKAEGFLLPEVLWWALDHTTAREQFKKAAKNCGETAEDYDEVKELGAAFGPDKGVVVLIDEIDKADSEVPNSLLETLSIGGFHVPYGGHAIKSTGIPPLIIITTNEDRELPAAFVRRCLVLQMDLPEDKDGALDHYLRRRVAAHFQDAKIDPEVCTAAIEQLKQDRTDMKQRDLTPPGQAELLDLLRAVSRLASGKEAQLAALRSIQTFAFRKHRQA